MINDLEAIDFKTLAASRLPSQFGGESGNFLESIEGELTVIQQTYDALRALFISQRLDYATGEALDFIGAKVGIPRRLENLVALGLFGFGPSPLVSGFGVGRFRGAGESIGSPVELTDRQYRRLIKAKIIKNNTQGLLEDAYTIADTILGYDSQLNVIENTISYRYGREGSYIDLDNQIELTGDFSIEIIARGSEYSTGGYLVSGYDGTPDNTTSEGLFGLNISGIKEYIVFLEGSRIIEVDISSLLRADYNVFKVERRINTWYAYLNGSLIDTYDQTGNLRTVPIKCIGARHEDYAPSTATYSSLNAIVSLTIENNNTGKQQWTVANGGVYSLTDQEATIINGLSTDWSTPTDTVDYYFDLELTDIERGMLKSLGLMPKTLGVQFNYSDKTGNF